VVAIATASTSSIGARSSSAIPAAATPARRASHHQAPPGSDGVHQHQRGQQRGRERGDRRLRRPSSAAPHAATTGMPGRHSTTTTTRRSGWSSTARTFTSGKPTNSSHMRVRLVSTGASEIDASRNDHSPSPCAAWWTLLFTLTPGSLRRTNLTEWVQLHPPQNYRFGVPSGTTLRASTAECYSRSAGERRRCASRARSSAAAAP
jgi:hypothetical protein